MSKNSSPRFRDYIDTACDAEKSVVLRYRNAFRFGATDEEDAGFKNWLVKTSIREGARVVPFLTYRDVTIHILDESSLMHSKSLKSIDGCFTTAKCKTLGYERTVLESGGNTGTALTEYGTNAGVETFCFIPEDNLSLLDSRTFDHPLAHLITVEKPGRVKRAAKLFARLSQAKHIPETSWRYDASQFRGCFILEHLLTRQRYDWLVQTISAAFGPIGIYRVLDRFKDEVGTVPRLLGVSEPTLYRWRDEFIAMGNALGGGSGWVLLVYNPRDRRLMNQYANDHTQAVAGGIPMGPRGAGVREPGKRATRPATSRGISAGMRPAW
jgi:hypothetical protein